MLGEENYYYDSLKFYRRLSLFGGGGVHDFYSTRTLLAGKEGVLEFFSRCRVPFLHGIQDLINRFFTFDFSNNAS